MSKSIDQIIINSGIIKNETVKNANTALRVGENLEDLGIAIKENVPSGLERVIENGVSGFRLIGSDPNDYGDIGKNAVSMTWPGKSGDTTAGAIGPASFAVGEESKAEGGFSFAAGRSCHAFGEGSIALGDGSHALGSRSIVIGGSSESTANHSIAIGHGTKASNYGSLALGVYNIGTSTDTLLEFGIGTNGQEKNAFEIFLDGTLTAPETTVAAIDSRGNKAVITKEYLDSITIPKVVADETALLAEKTAGNMSIFNRYTISLTADGVNDATIEIKFKSPSGDFFYERVDDNGNIELIKVD